MKPLKKGVIAMLNSGKQYIGRLRHQVLEQHEAEV